MRFSTSTPLQPRDPHAARVKNFAKVFNFTGHIFFVG